MSDGDGARRRFAIACAVGGAAGMVIFVALLLSASHGEMLRWQRLGDFYDTQAHALLDGDLAVDEYPLGIEAFYNDGRAYLYQGPWPALLRLPVAAVAGDRWDGRLTAPSMVIALAVVAAGAARLHWRVRQTVRPAAPVTRAEAVLVAVSMFGVGGSLFLFHASRAWVYHEAILWGAAFTVLAVDQLVAFVQGKMPRALGAASIFAALALASRASVGIGPVVGLALVAASVAWRWLRRRDGGFRAVVAAGAAAVLPLASYAAVNFAKFETLFSIPFWDQRFSQIDDLRQEFLRETGGTFFSIDFVPTTLLRYLLPTGFDLTRQFPFVDLAAPPASRVSMGTTFDVIDRAAGVPVAQPLFFVLAVVGMAALLRRDLAPLRIPAVAAAASAATIFPFGYIAYRYLADAAPFLIICGAIGTQVLVAALAGRGRGRVAVVASVVGASGLAVLSLWLNGSAGLQYQRVWSVEDDPAMSGPYIAWRLDLQERLGIDPPPVERAETELPEGVGRAGALLVLGDCDGVYVSDGEVPNSIDRSPWNPVERSRENGHIRLRLELPDRGRGDTVPLFRAGDDSFHVTYLDQDRIRIDHRSNDVDRDGLPLRWGSGDVVTVDMQADARVQHVTVVVEDVVALDNYYFELEPLAITWPADYRELEVQTPVCDRLLGRG